MLYLKRNGQSLNPLWMHHGGALKQKNVVQILKLMGWNPSYWHRHPAATAGWGRKYSGVIAHRKARSRNIPFLALEDGFIRSLDLGVRGSPTLSLIVDPDGIYYDAESPSKLERMLNDDKFFDEHLRQRAIQGRDILVQNKLSKYNSFEETQEGDIPSGRYVLVIDQTKNDESIKYGRACDASFTAMLDAAVNENPDDQIVIRTHPDVFLGHKEGHYDPSDKTLLFVRKNINPWDILRGASRVYTVTSQMGFEARLIGKDVQVFGMPFYAGWGDPGDRLVHERRLKKRTALQIFSVAYLIYPTYYCDETNELSSFEHVCQILKEKK